MSHEGTTDVGVLVLHGFTGNPSSMRGVAEAMAISPVLVSTMMIALIVTGQGANATASGWFLGNGVAAALTLASIAWFPLERRPGRRSTESSE